MKKYRLKVWGDFACFTRPEMKAERVSYDVITPSAARAIFEAILWKPAIRWVITEIEVLNPINWISIRRNEIQSRAALSKSEIFIEDDRAQRAGLFLKDVAYVLHAYFELTEQGGDQDSLRKFHEMFERRASKGQCMMQPYFGCREFSCFFELLSNPSYHIAIEKSQDLGWMLYDLDYSNRDIKPRFFKARLEKGVLNIPDWTSKEVRG